jgi:hypothetical protein
MTEALSRQKLGAAAEAAHGGAVRWWRNQVNVRAGGWRRRVSPFATIGTAVAERGCPGEPRLKARAANPIKSMPLAPQQLEFEIHTWGGRRAGAGASAPEGAAACHTRNGRLTTRIAPYT